MKVSYNDLNAIFGLDGINHRVVPFHYTHLKIMDIRKSENDVRRQIIILLVVLCTRLYPLYDVSNL